MVRIDFYSKIKKYLCILTLFLTIVFFYLPFILNFKVPVPLDTIVGLYNPYRDFYAASYPRGIPFKNFLITDPVRQTYVWKELVISDFKNLQLPLWNPYEMSGKPLLANFQSSTFYPLNLVLFLKPFLLSWSIFIMVQSFLAGFFMFLFLKNLKLDSKASLLGSIAFCFSGFSIAWLEWGTILQTALWLPIVLLSIDNITKIKDQRSKIKDFKNNLWYVVLIFSLVFSFFAGNLQIFFYLYIVSIFYFLLRWFEKKTNLKTLVFFIISNLFFAILTFLQWYPTLEFINLSFRNVDRNYKLIEGWFLPVRQLIQFVAPDFFGNPATLNYSGVFNYGELVGYVGVLPLVLSVYSFYRKNITVWFFTFIVFLSLIFSIQNPISVLPFDLNIPFISSAQPTRLIFLIVFGLCVLASFGFDYLIKKSKMKLFDVLPILIFTVVFAFLWALLFVKPNLIFAKVEYISIAKHNLILPTALFIFSSILVFLLHFVKKDKLRSCVLYLMVLLIIFDLVRFAQKFTPFTNPSYLYPQTSTIRYLENQKGVFRIGVLDNRIMPPNFFTHYKLQTIEGYDPLYLKNYAEFVKVMEGQNLSSQSKTGFNRIITPHNYKSQLFDFLNTKYVLSLDDITSQKFIKVFEEGQTKVYLNKKAYPRTFFVEKLINTKKDLDAVLNNNLSTTAVVSDDKLSKTQSFSVGKSEITSYLSNNVTITTSNKGEGFLVFSDVYYPTWTATIDDKPTKIYQTDHAFRGIFVPRGQHTIKFEDHLF